MPAAGKMGVARVLAANAAVTLLLAVTFLIVCWPRRHPEIMYHRDSSFEPPPTLFVLAASIFVAGAGVGVAIHAICRRFGLPVALSCPAIAGTAFLGLIAAGLSVVALVRWDVDVLEALTDLFAFHALGALVFAGTVGLLNAALICVERRRAG